VIVLECRHAQLARASDASASVRVDVGLLRVMIRSVPLAIVGLLSSSCVTIQVPPPPVLVRTPEGDVRASTEADAKRVAALLVELAPRVRELLDETHVGPPRVDVLDHAVPYLGDAANYNGRIYLTPSARSMERFVLAHELVHWQISGTWRALPFTVQEGLADRIGTELAPEVRFNREMQMSLALSSSSVRDPIDLLDLSKREWSSLKQSDAASARFGVGYFIVERIGIERLHELCGEFVTSARARIPPERLLDEAALSPNDVRDWRIQVRLPTPQSTRALGGNAQAGAVAPPPSNTADPKHGERAQSFRGGSNVVRVRSSALRRAFSSSSCAPSGDVRENRK
jgi:hypothetical protein